MMSFILRQLHICICIAWFMLVTVQAQAEDSSKLANSDVVNVVTDTYDITFSNVGAVPVSWYLATQNNAASITQTRNLSSSNRFDITIIDPWLVEHGYARSLDLVEPANQATEATAINNLRYTNKYKIEGNAISLLFESEPIASGLMVKKLYRFPKQGYTSTLTLILKNTGKESIQFKWPQQPYGILVGPVIGPVPISEDKLDSDHSHSDFSLLSLGEVITPDLDEQFNIQRKTVDWVAIHNRFFMLAIIPDGDIPKTADFIISTSDSAPITTSTSATTDEHPLSKYLDFVVSPVTLSPGETRRFTYTLFAGPKQIRILKEAGHNLKRILFSDLWDWMRYLSLALMALLNALNSMLHNWGLAIIALAVLIRIILLPVTLRGQKHQAKTIADQAQLKPHLDDIKTRFKGDAERIHKETMQVYRDHGVSALAPLAGCLWVFLQIPIFVALYFVINESYDLRGVEFLWIKDLSRADSLFSIGFSLPYFGSHFNLLPVLMAASQIFATSVSSAPDEDPKAARTQRKFLISMALVFFILLYNFPSGLMLYWLMSNLGQIVQQHWWQSKQ